MQLVKQRPTVQSTTTLHVPDPYSEYISNINYPARDCPELKCLLGRSLAKKGPLGDDDSVVPTCDTVLGSELIPNLLRV